MSLQWRNLQIFKLRLTSMILWCCCCTAFWTDLKPNFEEVGSEEDLLDCVDPVSFCKSSAADARPVWANKQKKRHTSFETLLIVCFMFKWFVCKLSSEAAWAGGLGGTPRARFIRVRKIFKSDFAASDKIWRATTPSTLKREKRSRDAHVTKGVTL